MKTLSKSTFSALNEYDGTGDEMWYEVHVVDPVYPKMGIEVPKDEREMKDNNNAGQSKLSIERNYEKLSEYV